MFIDYAPEKAATAMLAKSSLQGYKIGCSLNTSYLGDDTSARCNRLTFADDDIPKAFAILRECGYLPGKTTLSE